MDRCYKGGKMIIAIDPGGTKPHALAYYKRGKLDFVYTTDNIQLIGKDIEYADKIFIENQYNGGFNSLVKLCQKTGMIMGLCELYGKDYEMVYPTVWQEYFHLLSRRPKEITKYKWGKIRAQNFIEKAEELTGYKPEDEDEAAAILIGYWAIHREHEQGK